MEKGICHICGKYTYLTFEHLPPQKAYNNKRVKIIQGEDIIEQVTGTKKPWDFDGLKYKYNQRGTGLLSLCKSCNNITGRWYGNEYIKISNSILEYIYDKDMEKITAVGFKFKEFYPLRFLKQVISMFASTFPDITISKSKNLKKFLLERDYTKLDIKKYRVTMYVLKTKRIGWTGINIIKDSNLLNNRKVATLDLYPLGFEFEFEPFDKAINLDITQFANEYGYNDKVSIDMIIPARERNIIFPCDYRTKEEIEEQRKKTIENHIKLMCNNILNNENKEKIQILANKYRENKINASEFTLEMNKIKNITL